MVQDAYTAPGWDIDWSYGGMYASINNSNGYVSCTIIWGGRGGEDSGISSTDGRIAVFALCQRTPRWVVPAGQPWIYISGGQNTSYPFSYGLVGTPIGLGIPVIAGSSYTFDYLSGTINSATGYHNALGDQLDGPAGLGFPISTANKYQAIGAWCDSAGNVLTTPFALTLTNSLTAYTGAVYLQVGMNGYTSPTSNPGSWTFSLSRSNATPLANKFAEIASTVFYPGNLIPASIGLQIYNNISEASLSPEIFGPTDYKDGNTISVPTSAVDGYVYSRAELMYIWDWKFLTTGPVTYPPSSDNRRLAQFTCNVNASTGAVAMSAWRLAPGGPYDSYPSGNSGISGAEITVWVVGFRSKQTTGITVQVTDNAPTDSTTTATDSTSQVITVNGT